MIVLADLDPVSGSEQAGMRPAMIVSQTEYNEVSRCVMVCPVTSNDTPWPTKVFLPVSMKTRGAVLCDQIRAIDHRNRVRRVIERSDPDTLSLVRMTLSRLLGLDLLSED